MGSIDLFVGFSQPLPFNTVLYNWHKLYKQNHMTKPNMNASLLSCFLFLLLSSSTAEAWSRGRGIVKGSGGRQSTADNAKQRFLKGSKSSKSSKADVGPTKRDCKQKSTKSSKSSKESGGGSMEFECSTKGEGVDDKIKFKVDNDDDGLTISVEYKQKGDDVDDVETEDEIETEIKTMYSISFDQIIEYRQLDEWLVVDPPEVSTGGVAITRQSDLGTAQDDLEMDDPPVGDDSNATLTDDVEQDDDYDDEDPNAKAFDWDSDEILQAITLGDWDEFSDIDDDGSRIKFSITSDDGLATFYFTIVMDDMDDLSVNKMKIDFELTNFPWEADDSYVALVSSVASGQKIKVLDTDDDDEDGEDDSSPSSKKKGHGHTKKEVQISFEDAASVMEFLPFGDYTWKEEAEAYTSNGNETDVAETASDLNTENSNTTDSSTAQTRSRSGGATIQVVATSPESSATPDSEDYAYNQENGEGFEQSEAGTNRIAFSFVGKPAQKAESIYWDPSVGVGYNSAATSQQTSSASITVSLMTLASLVSTLALSF